MRCRLVVLWILLALLPLRGWAFSSMQVEMAISDLTAATLEFEPAIAAPALPPCHEVAAKAGPDSATPNSDVAGSGHAGCALCDLCYSVAIVDAAPALDAVQFAVAHVGSFTRTDTGRSLVGGLDRPPRLFIA